MKILIAALLLTGCAVQPPTAGQLELQRMINGNMQQMYQNQAQYRQQQYRAPVTCIQYTPEMIQCQ